MVCARYRYDAKRMKRTTTVELVESENDWVQNKNKKPSNKIVQIRIAYGVIHLGNLGKAAGGNWNRNKKVWELLFRFHASPNPIRIIGGKSHAIFPL